MKIYINLASDLAFMVMNWKIICLKMYFNEDYEKPVLLNLVATVRS